MRQNLKNRVYLFQGDFLRLNKNDSMYYTQVCKYHLHANIRHIDWAFLWIRWNIRILHVYVTSHVIKMCQKKELVDSVLLLRVQY